MFMIYNDIDLEHPIKTENVQIEISYDTWNFDTKIEQPWTFNVKVSQAKLLEEKKAFEINKTITLNNGENVTIQKVVTTSQQLYIMICHKAKAKIFILKSNLRMASWSHIHQLSLLIS